MNDAKEQSKPDKTAKADKSPEPIELAEMTEADQQSTEQQPQEEYFLDQPQLSPQSMDWTASEYIAHDKTFTWYLILGLVALVIAGIVYLLTRDKFSVFVVVFGALMLGYYAAHKPRQLEYLIDSKGIQIGPKFYAFQEFKSFAVIPEGPFSSIVFMPHRRFAVPISIYYEPKDEAKITNIIATQLPFEERSHDPIDRLMRAIRF